MTEAQKGSLTHPGTHSSAAAELGLDTGAMAPDPSPLSTKDQTASTCTRGQQPQTRPAAAGRGGHEWQHSVPRKDPPPEGGRTRWRQTSASHEQLKIKDRDAYTVILPNRDACTNVRCHIVSISQKKGLYHQKCRGKLFVMKTYLLG